MLIESIRWLAFGRPGAGRTRRLGQDLTDQTVHLANLFLRQRTSLHLASLLSQKKGLDGSLREALSCPERQELFLTCRPVR
jgi:hypothetical protein